MQTKHGQFWCILLIGFLFLMVSVQGAVTTISQGNTVFIGEQGLDISAAMGTADTSIGWWASGADVRSSSPSKTMNVASQLNSFSVSPSVFSGYPGTWNRLDSQGNADGSAFIVADPQINLRLEDTTVGIDVTDKWVPTGDVIRFRIESNLAQISSQRGTPALLTIKVQPPGGGVFTALIDASGTPQSIVDIPITTTPQSTNSIWDTGNRANYAPGSYTIWAECNTNKMKDNYGQTGKTITPKISLLNQDQNPLIGAKTVVTTPATTVTTKPATSATTALPTTQVTIITSPPTTVPTAVPTIAESSLPVTPIPVSSSPSPTKTPGFESALAGISLIIGIIVYCKR
ncbi:DUF3821 domain-containing protein [uncultured Methanoregula sp.]|uniref:DUF3821 domain-containing protein n=1 Tax=uncultured Methanoregula sp. TaxID=1005933 RepID=UPI002AABF655|nr:DUF3821 domain-containing protein [uncultured Methanoregula sp.]